MPRKWEGIPQIGADLPMSTLSATAAHFALHIILFLMALVILIMSHVRVTECSTAQREQPFRQPTVVMITIETWMANALNATDCRSAHPIAAAVTTLCVRRKHRKRASFAWRDFHCGERIGVTADFISPLRIPAGVHCERPPLFFKGAHV